MISILQNKTKVLLQIHRKNKKQVGKILLTILFNKEISLLFKRYLQKKIVLFHQIMKK